MATPYLKIYNHNGYADNRENYTAPGDVASEVGANGVPGRQIMALAAQLAGVGAGVTFAHLFQAFNTTPLRGTWTWNGRGGGSTITGLADGDKRVGECEHFAKALWFLARCPSPWGLGLGASQIDRPNSYKGESDEGFVSHHNGVFINLAHNVKPAAGYGGTPLYYWSNHKTVKYGDQYYDVCYQTTYQNRQDMAEYQLTGQYGRTDADAVWNPVDMSTLHFQAEGKTAEKATRNRRYYYFRLMSNAEQTVTQSHEGPISETALEVMRMNARGLNMV